MVGATAVTRTIGADTTVARTVMTIATRAGVITLARIMITTAVRVSATIGVTVSAATMVNNAAIGNAAMSTAKCWRVASVECRIPSLGHALATRSHTGEPARRSHRSIQIAVDAA